jgi:fucose 4-O-acetylase-like acetyltransferase
VTLRSLHAGPVRLAWLDCAKGLGIILVVFGHANRSIGRTGDVEWTAGLRFVDEIIYAFHMPLFFVLAGIAVALTKRPDVGSSLRSLGWSIVAPYLIWSAAWIGVKLLVPGSANHPLSTSDLLWAPVVPVEHFWFLYHLFFARLFWIGVGLLDTRQLRTVPVLAALFLAASVLGGGTGWSDAIGYFFGNVGFLGIGLVVSSLLSDNAGAEPRWSLPAAGLFFAALFLALRPTGVSASMFVVALAGVVLTILAARALAAGLPSLGVRLLGFLGEASLAIYVLHLFIIALFRPVLKVMGVSGVPMLTVDTVAAVGLPALAFAITLAAGLAAQRPLARWLGFGSALRSHYFNLNSAVADEAATAT